MTSIPELIRTEAVQVHHIPSDNHIQRLESWVGRPQILTNDKPELLRPLLEAGFIWVVRSDFVRKFPYAAKVRATHRFGMVMTAVRRDEILYQGDIPESIIDKMEQVKRIAVDYDRGMFTVHSAHPLPVRYAVANIDPVMIYWLNPMYFINTAMFGLFRHTYPSTAWGIGVVVGVWDRDKELAV